jgi:hypothetical protein
MGIEEPLAAFHEPPRVTGERKPSGDDPNGGTFGEKGLHDAPGGRLA